MGGWAEGGWINVRMYVRTDDSDLLEFLHNKSNLSVSALLLLHPLPIFQATLAFQLDDSDKHGSVLVASDKIEAIFYLLCIL